MIRSRHYHGLFTAAVFGPTDSAFGDVSGVIAGLDQGALATVRSEGMLT